MMTMEMGSELDTSIASKQAYVLPIQKQLQTYIIKWGDTPKHRIML